ncbi:MAG: hypothetical protein ACR2QH_00355 [Geminicoccaceae bacterium]
MHTAFELALIAAMALTPLAAIVVRSAELEHSAMARLAAEIDLLAPLIAPAESQTDCTARLALNNRTLEARQDHLHDSMADADG